MPYEICKRTDVLIFPYIVQSTLSQIPNPPSKTRGQFSLKVPIQHDFENKNKTQNEKIILVDEKEKVEFGIT